MAMLYIIATPIGNLEDMSLRALRILQEVSYILAEDTRVTKKLLAHFDIHTPIQSYHNHSRAGKEEQVIQDIQGGKSVALVSDAGTPTISDPGVRLIEKAKHAGIIVTPIPGPSAITTALSVSGIPADQYLFLGFLPRKKKRKKVFERIAAEETTIVFFESPHRILKTLQDLAEYIPDRHIVLAKELTKIHEEIIAGTPQEIITYFEAYPDKVRGEFVVIVSIP